MKRSVRGTLDQVITNDKQLFDGDLVAYFQAIFTDANNVLRPYHNFRHMMHVTWLCYNACEYYGDRLDRRERRNLLVAAIFHDFDHSGERGDDAVNIENAIAGLQQHILPEDQPYLEEIMSLIGVTQYPYTVESEGLGLAGQILRDADLSQSLSPTWLQQVVFGLAAEWNIAPIEILKEQSAFHKKLKFNTEWAKQMWPQEQLEAKQDEIDRLIQVLDS